MWVVRRSVFIQHSGWMSDNSTAIRSTAWCKEYTAFILSSSFTTVRLYHDAFNMASILLFCFTTLWTPDWRSNRMLILQCNPCFAPLFCGFELLRKLLFSFLLSSFFTRCFFVYSFNWFLFSSSYSFSSTSSLFLLLFFFFSSSFFLFSLFLLHFRFIFCFLPITSNKITDRNESGSCDVSGVDQPHDCCELSLFLSCHTSITTSNGFVGCASLRYLLQGAFTFPRCLLSASKKYLCEPLVKVMIAVESMQRDRFVVSLSGDRQSLLLLSRRSGLWAGARQHITVVGKCVVLGLVERSRQSIWVFLSIYPDKFLFEFANFYVK